MEVRSKAPQRLRTAEKDLHFRGKAKEYKRMAKTGPIEFLKQVRNEGKKITWPTRQETTVSTIMVFIMVFIAAIFLYVSDQIIAWLIRLILGFGL